MDYEEDDEEQKMELFFALVKSTREVREKLMKGEHKGIHKENEDKPPPPPPVVWNPCFRPEDFMEDVVQLKAAGCGSSTGSPVIPRTSLFGRGDKEEKNLMEEVEPPSVSVSVAAAGTCKREDKESEDVDKGGDSGLDLNLSL
ncbi:unnamed protein product [Fraxinus pennsylvanica]|uniref:Uncharacterized protein n=1 Tax=Fraxinus pennsylvanica TaxID=56036 RepID=A0AAD1ZB83_9LAMI|nr:unnamed protein product [Fraxinus pennsylvanica]